MNTTKQRQLPFEPTKEQARRQRVEHLLIGDRRLTTAARMFDEKAYREATQAAAHHTPPIGLGTLRALRRIVSHHHFAQDTYCPNVLGLAAAGWR
ncbi:MAG: hypothetical protein IH831_08680 [Planctomycetes bacterium]|nr:hypothetical protein [Planctomycetota bacterium]